MSFNTIFTILFFITIYVIGVIISGKFYKWAYESENIIFEVDDSGGRLVLSAIWFLSIPFYFIILMFYYPFKGLILIYEKFVEKV